MKLMKILKEAEVAVNNPNLNKGLDNIIKELEQLYNDAHKRSLLHGHDKKNASSIAGSNHANGMMLGFSLVAQMFKDEFGAILSEQQKAILNKITANKPQQ